jgi:predicted transglutaminase-like cysteine proteinase
MKKIFCLIAFIMLSACSGMQTNGSSLRTDVGPADMTTGAAAVAPRGFVGYCMKYRIECIPTPRVSATVELTDSRRHELDVVQAKVNRDVRPRANPEHNWEYPDNGYGDCNQYTIAKRRELIALGWPRASLLLAAAMTETDEGHLVLVVVTSQGDYVLDNRQRAVVPWEELPYRWLERQSETNAAAWVSIVSPRPVS